MGVPVVTLRGATLPGRNSASILTALAMQDWIAERDDDYLRIALSAQRDLKRLASVRSELRERARRSPHGDLAAYTRAVESEYRSMWRRWCSLR